MRTTSIVAAIATLACGLGPAGPAGAQFGPIGTEGARPRGDLGMRTGEDQRGARETQAAGRLVKVDTPVAWEAVRKHRATGRPAMLGITINDHDQGVAVLRVSPGGPADESGVEAGDLVVAVDGIGLTESEHRTPLSRAETLIAQIGTVKLGDTVTLTVRRGDDVRDIEIEAREFGPGSYFVL